MKNKLLISILIIFILNITNSYTQDDNFEELKKISKNIRCLICQGQSIDESNSDFAINVKYLILKKLDEGSSETEIYNFDRANVVRKPIMYRVLNN